MISELHERMMTMNSGALPAHLGYSWQQSPHPRSGGIIFEDALGRIIDLPWQLCKDWEVNN
jgi:hypothetical protein